MRLDDQILELVSSIWNSMLSLTIEPLDSNTPLPPTIVSAVVTISGEWQGAVVLSFEPNMAVEAAMKMFALPANEVKVNEIRDALGELANMVGGNVKSLIPGNNHLSLPMVVEGADYSIVVPRSSLVLRIPLRCGDEQVHVSLLKSEKAAA